VGVSIGSVNISHANSGSFAGGTGTEIDPYLIETAEHLNNVRNFMGITDVYFRQIADINLGVAPWNTGEGWVPLGGHFADVFMGTYN